MKFPAKLRPLLTTPKTHNIIAGGRGGAKTRSIGGLLVRIMAAGPVKILCGRETQKSLAESSFATLREEIYRQGLGAHFNIRESRGVITSTAGARAVFIGLKEHTVDSIKSYEGFHWAWIEEAQSVSKKSLDILIPTLREDGAFRIKLGNRFYTFPLRMFVYSMNPFAWDDAVNIVLPEGREDTQWININYYDNPWFPGSLNSERLEARKIMSPEEYARVWEGIPYEDSERVIIKRADAQAAMKRKVSLDGGVVVGCDIARYGSDKTVLIKREGLQVVDMVVLSKSNTQETARTICDMIEGTGGRAVVDDTGVGGGVTDKLEELGVPVLPVNFGSRAENRHKYPDIISEMWFELAGQLKDIGLIDDLELLAEISSRHFSYTRDDRRKVESKEEYKKRTGRHSPDKADALILCYYSGGYSQIGRYK